MSFLNKFAPVVAPLYLSVAPACATKKTVPSESVVIAHNIDEIKDIDKRVLEVQELSY